MLDKESRVPKWLKEAIKRKELKLTPELISLLEEIDKMPPAVVMKEDKEVFNDESSEKYREFITKLGPKKWESYVIKNIPEGLISTLQTIINFFSYGEMYETGNNLYFTIEH